MTSRNAISSVAVGKQEGSSRCCPCGWSQTKLSATSSYVCYSCATPHWAGECCRERGRCKYSANARRGVRMVDTKTLWGDAILNSEPEPWRPFVRGQNFAVKPYSLTHLFISNTKALKHLLRATEQIFCHIMQNKPVASQHNGCEFPV